MAYTADYETANILDMAIDLAGEIFYGLVQQAGDIGSIIAIVIILALVLYLLTTILKVPTKTAKFATSFKGN